MILINHCSKSLYYFKVVAVNIHQTVQVDDELEIKAYYAGHVILFIPFFQVKIKIFE